jgi:hypothetical protein
LSGWNPRTIRSLASRRISAIDKVRDMWYGMRLAQTVMKKWKRTSEEYVKLLEARLGQG